VGGGVIGWSCAWHLLHGEPNLHVVVIDPDPSRCTSLRGAGGSRAQFATEVNIALSLLSIQEFEKFAAEVGTDIGYRQHGYLLFTADENRAAKMKEAAEFQRQHGVRLTDVTTKKLKERVPCINTSDIVYAQIGLQDGYMDGPKVVQGYRHAAMRLGAQEMQSKAVGIAANHIDTSEGAVNCKTVVVAAGHWAGNLGLDLPVKPEKHQLFFDTPPHVDHKWPFTIDADTTFHFRPDGNGILVCYNDPPLASGTHHADDPPTFEDSVLERLLPIADHRAPGLLRRDRIERGRAGYYAVTPDRHPILGEMHGMVIATGFGGHGVMHSPAAGKLVSEIILDGEARSADISVLSPDRFASGKLIAETMVF